MNVVRVLAVVACVAVSTMGHAVIVTPAPFNTNPSKSFGCGGATAGPLNIIPGTSGSFDWKLVAQDGDGAIRMLIDPAGGSGGAFPQSYGAQPTGAIVAAATLSGTTPAVVGTTYTFDYTLPAGLTCTGNAGGSNSVCTVQVSSVTGWVSCFYFTKTQPTQAGSTGGVVPAANGNCVTISTPLATCTQLTGKTVWVPTGQNTADMDASVLATMTQNLPNVNVFLNQPQRFDVVTPCQASYKDFLCAQAMFPCNTAKTAPATGPNAQQPCLSTCQAFTCWCDLNDIHYFLYDCNVNNYLNVNTDSTGQCGKKKYSTDNSTCIPRIHSSTAGTCPVGQVCAAPHTASHSGALLAAVVATVAAVLYANNH